MTKTRVIISIIVVCTAFSFGRFSSPEKVRIEKEIVEVEKKTTEKDSESERNKHKESTVKETTRPDGTKETVITTEEDTTTGKKSSEKGTDDTSKTDSSSEERTRSHVVVSALVGLPTSFPLTPVYGAAVSSEIIGPINCGVWALTSGVAGVSIGLSF